MAAPFLSVREWGYPGQESFVSVFILVVNIGSVNYSSLNRDFELIPAIFKLYSITQFCDVDILSVCTGDTDVAVIPTVVDCLFIVFLIKKNVV